MAKLDAKFYGEIRKVKDDSVVPPDEYVVFLVKDNAFLPALARYIDTCKELGCDAQQIASAERMMVRAKKWRAAHPDRCKNPDAAGEKLLG